MNALTILKKTGLFVFLFLFSVPGVFAGQYCTSDSNGDCKVDLTDLLIIKQEYMSSDCQSCSLPTPVRIPVTGQQACYDTAGNVIVCSGTGQDGEYQMGVQVSDPGIRFTDNGDGTVTDGMTGLTWLKNANCFGLRTWSQALSDCNGLADSACGLTDGSVPGDWRLPNILELSTLIDFGASEPGTPLLARFDSVSLLFEYWSSTTYAGDTTAAWVGDGLWDKSMTSLVWPVKGLQ